LHRAVSKALARAHASQSSRLKATVAANPEFFTQRDPPKLRATLRDQRSAGKKLALITNSGYAYTDTMMRFVCGEDWRSFFDVVFVSARKPNFFTTERLPCYELILPGAALQELPLLRETAEARAGGVYHGGSARLVEKLFGVSANDVLYVGDHVFVDANAAKASMRWRTALVVQELEPEIRAFQAENDKRQVLRGLLLRKDQLSARMNALRCHLRRYEDAASWTEAEASVVDDELSATLCRRHLARLSREMRCLDDQIAPAVRAEGEAFNSYWGYISRAGPDKSSFQRQIEKYADIYTARVTNLLPYTPYHYWRAYRSPLPHESDVGNIEDLYDPCSDGLDDDRYI